MGAAQTEEVGTGPRRVRRCGKDASAGLEGLLVLDGEHGELCGVGCGRVRPEDISRWESAAEVEAKGRRAAEAKRTSYSVLDRRDDFVLGDAEEGPSALRSGVSEKDKMQRQAGDSKAKPLPY